MLECSMKPPASIIPDGWTADDISITCPHGERREHDGSFDSADCECTNFMKDMGFI